MKMEIDIFVNCMFIQFIFTERGAIELANEESSHRWRCWGRRQFHGGCYGGPGQHQQVRFFLDNFASAMKSCFFFFVMEEKVLAIMAIDFFLILPSSLEIRGCTCVMYFSSIVENRIPYILERWYSKGLIQHTHTHTHTHKHFTELSP